MKAARDAPFTREWLKTRGFAGFARFSDLDLELVPKAQGVYVLLRENVNQPAFLPRSPAGWFKGEDPTEDVEVLRRRWIDGIHCIYIGKADLTPRTSLRRRLNDFRRFGWGEDVGHKGGRYVWQLHDAADFLVAWMVTSERPIEVENRLVSEFEALHGRLPFGNISRPRQPRSMPRGFTPR